MNKRTKIVVIVICVVVSLLALPVVVGFLSTLELGKVIYEDPRFPSSAELLSDDWPLIPHPDEGFVPDEETAKKIAEAVWTPIFGNQSEYKPFVVVLIDNKTWIVSGTRRGMRKLRFLGKETTLVPIGYMPYIEIDKQSGAILGVAWY